MKLRKIDKTVAFGDRDNKLNEVIDAVNDLIEKLEKQEEFNEKIVDIIADILEELKKIKNDE